MKLWLLDYHPAYANIQFEQFEDFERLTFAGHPLANAWIPPRMTGTLGDQPSDFLKCHNGALLLTQKAKALFERHLQPGEVEFLPVPHGSETLYFAHVLNLVSCIDAANSKLKCLSNGMLSEYERYAFHASLVEPHRMLRVRFHEGDRLVQYPFVGDVLHEAITNSDLTGYQLIEMWDSDYSWQQHEADYQAMIDAVTDSLTMTFDYSTAVNHCEQRGIDVYSGKWAMRHDPDNGLQLGDLMQDGTYNWIDPYFIPPILLSLTWGIIDPLPEKPALLDKIDGVFAGRKKS
ncbi:imm11 family protein [Paenibacillus sacheonensis]|uniref:Immunity MXAN-0049 protein domain-containing protein n=1 Tax=Paenibacillus sacheonensis TaxID=742054 RepID=A0A7X5C192_9BACL|nr:DUF1629 domain-containing protein [Paenibacillus sacheonensis]MBM7568822.1 hypothetical protein [Paenibacillus sacheonensis]NBC72527.1 hypothetical protein [Paenibacillus sacheonensis]